MIATAQLRRRAGQRISSALWGLLVMGAGGLMIATLSGYEIDLQLILIIVLGALGIWLLLSAAVSSLGRQKQVAQATAPVVEEPAAPSKPAEGKTTGVKATPDKPAPAAAPAGSPTMATTATDSVKPSADAASTTQDPTAQKSDGEQTGAAKTAQAKESLKPDTIAKRPAPTKRKSSTATSAKPTTKKSANKQPASKPAKEGSSAPGSQSAEAEPTNE